ncbi:MAG: transglycosylase domain-containing protein, partial [Myxococcota bacterium]|nr:transglycosylase domain-containing protein [Myxococcota bacterium]
MTPAERLKAGLKLLIGLVTAVGLAGTGVLGGAFYFYSQDVPSIEALGRYRPPTVTVIRDVKGRVLGEIYEKRRYVVPLEEIPQHVQDAFIAAEDARFATHTGVDPEGIVRAVLRNLIQGKKAQGASTITQQVARNFLLTSEKTYKRKIKEIILARRIESLFDKEHILYLYLNQLYLGSGAYGVEAASREYFDRHVGEITLAQAAILAGLPQRPSDYSPKNHWDKARARQEYVLGQMRDKGFIDQKAYEAAVAEAVVIHDESNPFLTQAPYFTEHIRRYLVETYGFDKVYNDGLVVDSTCDLDLQTTAQEAVRDGVIQADERVGWRGPVDRLNEEDIEPRLTAMETQLKEEDGDRILRVAPQESGLGGLSPAPPKSVLVPGEIYEAVVLEVARKHAVVGIGVHRALVPLSWTRWGYKPNTELSFKWRSAKDMTEVLGRGDLVKVRLEGTSSEEFDNLKGYSEAGEGPFAAARLYQDPELEGALFSYRV